MPEVELLSLLSRVSCCDSVMQRAVRLVPHCANTALFVRGASREKVFPAVSENLGHLSQYISIGALQDARKTLRHMTLAGWLPKRSRILSTQKRIQSLLASEGIPFLFMKGVSIANTYYETPELRVGADVDMLIRPEDRTRLWALFHDNGFVPFRDIDTTEAFIGYLCQYELVDTAQDILVDVSWNLIYGAISGNSTPSGRVAYPQVDMESVWERAVSIGPCEYRLTAEDEYLNVVRHLVTSNGFSGMLRYGADVSAILARTQDQFDVDHVIREAERSECTLGLKLFVRYYRFQYMCHDDSIAETAVCLEARCAELGNVDRALHDIILPYQFRAKYLSHADLSMILLANVQMTYAFATSDQLWRAFSLLRAVFWPTRFEMLLFLDDIDAPKAIPRMAVWYILMSLLTPAILVGMTLAIARRCDRP